MDIRYFCSLSGLRVPISSSKVSFNFNRFELCLSRSIIVDHFSDKAFIDDVGLGIYEAIKKNPFLYYLQNSPFPELSKNSQERYSDEFIEQIDSFVSALWFVKDNSVNVLMMLVYDHSLPNTVSGSLSHNYSTCEGLIKETSFTIAELEQAKNVLIEFSKKSSITHEKHETDYISDGYSIRPTKNTYIEYNTTNRIERAVGFLGLARTAFSLVQKIPLYMPIFEALFSTSTTELAHQISERVAFYIGDDTNRWEIYKTMKDGYDFRSRFFHGSPLSKFKDIASQRKLAKRLDEITRQVLNKIIFTDSDKFIFKNTDTETQKFNEWLLRLVIK